MCEKTYHKTVNCRRRNNKKKIKKNKAMNLTKVEIIAVIIMETNIINNEKN